MHGDYWARLAEARFAEGWRTDLRLLARELKRRAYAPFALISEEDFDREVARLDGEIPGLTDTQIIVADDAADRDSTTPRGHQDARRERGALPARSA